MTLKLKDVILRPGLYIEGLDSESETNRWAANHALNSTPGMQRERAVAALAEIGKNPAFSVAFGQSLAVSNGMGEVLSRKQVSELAKSHDEVDIDAAALIEDASHMSFMHERLVSDLLPGSTGLNKVITVDGVDFPVHCGTFTVVAGSGVGKTPLLRWIASSGGTKRFATVRVGEPFAGNTSNNTIAAQAIAAAAAGYTDIVIDSIKDLLGSAGGGLTKGGVSRVALSMLSHWSALGAALGVTFYVPLNPSTGDPETLAAMVEAARSSSTTSVNHDGNKWNYTLRPYEGAERETGVVPFAGVGRDRATEQERDRVSAAGAKVTRISLESLDMPGIFNRATTSL